MFSYECHMITIMVISFPILTQNILYVPDGEAIKLPENLESLPKAEHFPTQRHRWNTNEVRMQVLIFCILR